MSFARFDTWERSTMGPAAAGTQVYIATQPVNANIVVGKSIGYNPTPVVQLYSDPEGQNPISQPLSCDGFGHAYAYCVAGTYTVITVNANRIQHVLYDQLLSTSVSALTLETNGTPNTEQSLLNIVGAGSVSVSTDDSGDVTITGTSSAPPVTSVFGRTGAITAQSGDYASYYDALGAAAAAQSAAEAASDPLGSAATAQSNAEAFATALANGVVHTGSTSTTTSASTWIAADSPSTYPLGYASSPLPTATLPAPTMLLAPAIGSAVTISSYSVASSVITCQYTSTVPLVFGQTLCLYGFPTSTFLNGVAVTVKSTGLSSSQFEAALTGHNGASATETGYADTSTLGSVFTGSSWFINSDQLWIMSASGTVPTIGSTILLQNSAHASYLNGQTPKVSYQGFYLTAAFTHADAYGLYDSGVVFSTSTSSPKSVVVTGWAILSNVLYLFYQSSSIAVPSVIATLEGFVAGAAILNGQSVTLSSSGSLFCICPYSASNDNATETLTCCQIMNASAMSAGSTSTLATLGLLESYTAILALGQTANGRVWVGLGDARFLAGGLLGTHLTPNSDPISELVTDSPSYSFIGFRYSVGAGDTAFQCVCNNAGTQTTVSSGVAADTNAHTFAFTYTGSAVVFTIDGTTVATISTNLPRTSLTLSEALSVDNADNCGDNAYVNSYRRYYTTLN